MTITPEVSAKTLTQLVATEIRVQMARVDVRQSQLAREIGKTEQWLSVRLRGRQPIDLNDLSLIAHALGVGVHELLPPPEVAAKAAAELNKILATAQVRLMPDVVRTATPRPIGQPRRDAARPVSAIPANRRRPVTIRPTAGPIAS